MTPKTTHLNCHLNRTHIVNMAELDAFQDLPEYPPDCLLRQSIRTSLKVIQDSVIHKLKDQIKALLATEHLNEVD